VDRQYLLCGEHDPAATNQENTFEVAQNIVLLDSEGKANTYTLAVVI
jgi:hypothetical protein